MAVAPLNRYFSSRQGQTGIIFGQHLLRRNRCAAPLDQVSLSR